MGKVVEFVSRAQREALERSYVKSNTSWAELEARWAKEPPVVTRRDANGRFVWVGLTLVRS